MLGVRESRAVLRLNFTMDYPNHHSGGSCCEALYRNHREPTKIVVLVVEGMYFQDSGWNDHETGDCMTNDCVSLALRNDDYRTACACCVLPNRNHHAATALQTDIQPRLETSLLRQQLQTWPPIRMGSVSQLQMSSGLQIAVKQKR